VIGVVQSLFSHPVESHLAYRSRVRLAARGSTSRTPRHRPHAMDGTMCNDRRVGVIVRSAWLMERAHDLSLPRPLDTLPLVLGATPESTWNPYSAWSRRMVDESEWQEGRYVADAVEELAEKLHVIGGAA
jgi:hypothetical protein